MLTKVEITIRAVDGFIPGEVQLVIGDMIRDYRHIPVATLMV